MSDIDFGTQSAERRENLDALVAVAASSLLDFSIDLFSFFMSGLNPQSAQPLSDLDTHVGDLTIAGDSAGILMILSSMNFAAAHHV